MNFQWISGWYRGTLASLLAGMLVIGCEETEIRVYEAPKDPPTPETVRTAAQGDIHDPQGAAPLEQRDAPRGDAPGGLSWQPPEDWVASSRDVSMRLATYYVGGTDAEAGEGLEVAVSAFPGDVGGRLANVNRWREQLGLEGITAAELDAYLQPFGEEDGVHGWTLRLDGPEPTAGRGGMLAAIIRSPRHERTWFVRAFAETAQLDAHEGEVRAFAESFHEAGHGHEQPPPYGHAHADVQGHDHHHHGASADGYRNAELILDQPVDWRGLERSSSIVYASYEAGPTERGASVAVTPLAGDGGGLFANINLWRQQLGLPGVEDRDEQPIEDIDVDGRPGKLVNVAGESVSLVAAVVPDGDRTWFFRISGPPDIVDHQRENFERFVRTARFREP